MPRIQNKKIILLFGCIVLFFPGAFVFGFPGVMASQWQEMFDVNKAQIGRLMFFILAGTGFSMYLAGRLQEKFSFHRIIFVGSLVCGLAMVFVGRATSMTQVYVWAFIEGFFCGFVYIPCLTFFQRLFPERKGLVTGLLNLTFGGSAAVMSPLFTFLLVSRGYTFTSDAAAALSILIGTTVTGMIRMPTDDKDSAAPMASSLQLAEILKMPSFWSLWLVWALSGAAGVSLIVLTASFGTHLGYEITQYVYILTCFNVFNGAGRLACGRLADILPKQKILITVYFMAALAYCLMAFSTTLVWVCVLACFVGLAFGGLFVVSAPLVTEVFGLENFGKVFGLVFTAYGFFAGALGPWLSGLILDTTGSDYRIVFFMFAAFYLISGILILRVTKE